MLAFNAAASFSHYAGLAQRVAGIPLALVPALHPGSGWAEARPVSELLLRADLVLPFTEHEREAVLRRGVAPERVRVIAPGVPAADAVPRAAARARLGLGDGPIVGFVGRQVEDKGIETLLDALPRVWTRRADVRLLLAGRVQGSFAAEREARLRALGARRDRVVALDAFDAADAPAILAACDVVAVPSTCESFGLVYLEAWLQERPVVALRGGPPACLVRHGEDGWLVPPGAPDALADALVALLGDAGLRARLGRAGRQRALARYSLEGAIAATRAACESLAAPAAQARAQRSTAAGASSRITRSL
jgi:glycosyltransferase involved in cell wall biosynthesis